MGKYVERHLYENELIVEEASRDPWGLIGIWVLTVLFGALAGAGVFVATKEIVSFTDVVWAVSAVCAVGCLITAIIAIVKTIIFTHTELVLTNKRIVYKHGVFQTKAFDTPLNKLQDVRVKTTFWGRVINTNRIYIVTSTGSLIYEKIQNADEFKSIILGQINQFEEDRLARQAQWTAQAMARSMPMQPTQEQMMARQREEREQREKDQRKFDYYGY